MIQLVEVLRTQPADLQEDAQSVTCDNTNKLASKLSEITKLLQ
jgi:hypothetical protein